MRQLQRTGASRAAFKKPCPVTGSTEDDFVIFGVPELIESFTEEDTKALRLETLREAAAGDESALQELSDITAANLAGTSDDPPSAAKNSEQVQADYEDNVAANPATYLRQYQDHRTSLVVLQAQVEGDKTKSKFASMLYADIASAIEKLNKAIKLLEVMVGKAQSQKAVKKLAADLTTGR